MGRPRVIVTRPAEQAAGFVDRLRALGVDAVALPLIRIEPVADVRPLAEAWQRLDRQALVMFVSANAVQHFFRQRPVHVTWPVGVRAGGTGPGTQAALLQAGVPAACIVVPPPEGPHDTETLWTLLRGHDWAGRTVLLVRGEQGRDWLATQLQAAGATTVALAAYRRLPPLWGTQEQGLLEAVLSETSAAGNALQAWHFSSSEAIAHLARHCQTFTQPGLRQQAATAFAQGLVLATHARIADAARAAGFGHVQTLAVGPEAVAAWAASIESPPL